MDLFDQEPENHHYAVVDVETTGLNPLSERVIEIGVILLDSNFRTESEWSTLINPQRPVTASHVHGIRDAAVACAPSFGDVAAQLVGLLNGRVFVAHNAPFDQGFLNMEFARAGLAAKVRTENLACTMDQSRIYCPPGPHSLIGLAQRLGLATHQDHRGLSDARIAATLLRHYAQLEGAGKRYANFAKNQRSGASIYPAQWLTAAPMNL